MRPCFSDPQTQLLLALPLLMPEAFTDDDESIGIPDDSGSFFCVEQHNRKLAHLVPIRFLIFCSDRRQKKEKNVEEAFQLCYIAFREHNLKHAGRSLLYLLGS